jgi:hypothetical protein
MEETKCYCGHTTYCDCGPETLEEAAKRWNEKQTTLEFGKPYNAPNRINAFIEGAKWQQERSYSEEEVIEIIFQKRMPYMTDTEIIEWFNKFKKK